MKSYKPRAWNFMASECSAARALSTAMERSSSRFDPITLSVIVFIALLFSGVSGKNCSLPFDDLASKTLKSKAIFSGNPIAADLALQPPPDLLGVQVVEFQMEEEDFLKTDRDFPAFLGKGKVLVGWNMEGQMNGCRKFTFQHDKYFIFLNGTASTVKLHENQDEEQNSRNLYWASGSPVKYTTKSQKMINRFGQKNYGRKPKVILSPKHLTLTLDDRLRSLDLRCRAFGRPSPQITWYKGVELISDQRAKISNDGARLTVRRVKVSDSGSYFCSASNVIGSVNSSTVNVNVRQRQHPSDFFKCSDQSYCVNHGTCYVNNISDLFCACPNGFTGKRCQDRTYGKTGEIIPSPMYVDSNLRSFIVVGLILFALILLVLTVIAYCIAMTRYDNAKRMIHWTDDDARSSDVRANGALLRQTLNGLQMSEKLQDKFSTSDDGGGRGGGGGGGTEVDVESRLVGLPQVLVTLIEEDVRATSAKRELPFPSGNPRRPDMRVYCPDARSSTFPILTRPRLTAVSTTPSSAASSINLHIDNHEPIPKEHLEHC